MLEQIHAPDDLRKLSLSDKARLADEIRRQIIATVAQNGGHLASNLGTVELTIALHSVYECPRDQIVFDVGHQAYTHKILTGRMDRLPTLRKAGGLSGFMRPSESPFDPCYTGHASSGISIGLGLSRANALAGHEGHVAVVIGDGALTGGMAYEALNDAGQSGAPMVVVLNDNEMSIGKNVGALSGYLTTMRQSTPYKTFKRKLRGSLNRLPKMLRFLERGRDALKALLVDDQFFSALGFEYQGPIDGHDLKRLQRVLARARDAQCPVLVHVITRKGYGYPFAEQAPDRFHGTGPFDIETGKPLSAESPANGATVCAALRGLAAKDSRVVAVTAAMAGGTGLTAFAACYPDRLFDVGIAEGHAVAMAAGLAKNGLLPYVFIYSTFLQRAYDQLIEDVCLPQLPVKLMIDRAGLVGADGVTHQGAFDLAYLRQMPHMIVAAPRDARDLKRLVALAQTVDTPIAIRYARDAEDMGPGMAHEKPLTVGEWEVLAGGDDVLLLAVGRMVQIALQTAIELHGSHVSCAVIDARFVKPMDETLLRKQAQRRRLIVTLEDGVVLGGFGEGVAAKLGEWGVAARVVNLGLPDRFVEQGSLMEQLTDCGLTSLQLAERIRRLLHGD